MPKARKASTSTPAAAVGGPPQNAAEVLEYFIRHPQAVRDFEDVARWRLLREHIYRGVEEVREALLWLVSEGFLVEERSAGSGSMFRLNRDRTASAEHLVARRRNPKGSGRK